MNHLYYVEHFPRLTKAGRHYKGFYTAKEIRTLMASGEYIHRWAEVTATCNGKKVEIRRRSGRPKVRFGKYSVGVESVE